MVSRKMLIAGTVLNIAVLLVAMSFAGWATSEVSQRVQLLSQISRRESDETAAVPTSDAAAPERLAKIRRSARYAREIMTTLIMYGGETRPETILSAFNRTFEAKVSYQGMAEDSDACLVALASLGHGWNFTCDNRDHDEDPRWHSWGGIKWGIRHTRSDFLLSLTMVACALVGSIVAALRSGDTVFNAKEAAVGLASGFIAFITLRGGRSVFMLESAGELPSFNAYSMALTGLLVGLFSPKAYALLTVLVEDLFQRLAGAFAAKGRGEPAKTAAADAGARARATDGNGLGLARSATSSNAEEAADVKAAR